MQPAEVRWHPFSFVIVENAPDYLRCGEAPTLPFQYRRQRRKTDNTFFE
jgi:hypothetical protein